MSIDGRSLKLRITFNNKKIYIPYFRSIYTIKFNRHPTKGLLIDLYLQLPNLAFIPRLFHYGTTYYFNERQTLFRVLVCRHWPKQLNEDRTIIITKHIVPFTELRFKGEREYPPGNWSILETGYVYLLDYYVKKPLVVYILYFERQGGILPARINKGSVYALYFDFVKSRDFAGLLRFDDDYYFRFQRIYTGKPLMELKNLSLLQPKMQVPYFYRNISRNVWKILEGV